MPTGKDFHRFCRELAREVGIGRAGLRRDWTVLEQLVRGRVLTQMTSQQVRELLDKDASQLHGEFNDLKALAAYGVARGWVDPKTLREALQAADQSNPLWFLANVSGKTFGGSVAPKLAEYWLCEEGDRWIRRKDIEYYDYDWYVAATESTIRFELKASSEKNPRFQQIRSPRMSGSQEQYDYDGCLCLGGYGGALEWWYFPVIAPQHGAHKIVSGTYWIVMTKENRTKCEKYRITSENLRDTILKQHA